VAHRYKVTIVGVHHNKKGAEEDPLDLVSGSTGLTGAADGVVVLHRPRAQTEGRMLVSVRGQAEREYALDSDKETFIWRCLGEADKVVTVVQQKILDALKAMKEATPSDICNRLGKDKKNRGNIKADLDALCDKGLVRPCGDGKYEPIPDQSELNLDDVPF
jgi:hypothetical protein